MSMPTPQAPPLIVPLPVRLSGEHDPETKKFTAQEPLSGQNPCIVIWFPKPPTLAHPSVISEIHAAAVPFTQSNVLL